MKKKKIINTEVKNDILNGYGNYIEIDNDNDEINTNDKNINLVINAKKQGYEILIQSMYNYLNNNKRKSFNDFLKKEWNDDYKIMISDTCYNRDYNNWKKIFNKIKENI
jgi:maltodextrin utilization protein YvdJ